MKDKNGIEIKLGQTVRTDEAVRRPFSGHINCWTGKVVRFGDHFESTRVPDLTPDTMVLVDEKGGFSLFPNWNYCEVLT